MIAISPAVTKDYAPANMPIAFVDVFVQRDELLDRTNLNFTLLDASKNRIPVNTIGLPKVTDAQLAAFVASAATAGDTVDQHHNRAALAIVSAVFGLTGTVQ